MPTTTNVVEYDVIYSVNKHSTTFVVGNDIIHFDPMHCIHGYSYSIASRFLKRSIYLFYGLNQMTIRIQSLGNSSSNNIKIRQHEYLHTNSVSNRVQYKNREHTLEKQNREELYKYIWGILRNKNCHLYRIGGITDHIHIITHIHPSISLASLVKDLKLASSDHIKSMNLFPDFNG